MHKVYQNSENHLSNHIIQNKDPTGQSEELHVLDQLSKFQFDLTIHELGIFILPRGCIQKKIEWRSMLEKWHPAQPLEPTNF